MLPELQVLGTGSMTLVELLPTLVAFGSPRASLAFGSFLFTTRHKAKAP